MLLLYVRTGEHLLSSVELLLKIATSAQTAMQKVRRQNSFFIFLRANDVSNIDNIPHAINFLFPFGWHMKSVYSQLK